MILILYSIIDSGVALGVVCFKGNHEIPQTFPVGKLTEHQGKQLVPASKMLHILVSSIFTHDVVKLVPVEETDQLRKNEFILMHCCSF